MEILIGAAIISIVLLSLLLSYSLCAVAGQADKAQEEYEANMVKILEVIEVDGVKYVPLADYQALMAQCEQMQPTLSNEQIIAAAGEDEVYS